MTSPGLRERKKQKTRWAIQEHALRLFADGYDATTVEQIAAAAEVSPSTFFRYFATKEDVVLQDEYDPVLVAGIEAAPAELSPLGALRYAFQAAFDGVSEDEIARIRERTKLVMSTPALRARTIDNLTASVQVFAEPLGRRVGRTADDYAVRVWAGALVGAAIVAIDEWLSGRSGKDFATLVEEAIGHMEQGFASGASS